jgi:hypothetical protein
MTGMTKFRLQFSMSVQKVVISASLIVMRRPLGGGTPVVVPIYSVPSCTALPILTAQVKAFGEQLMINGACRKCRTRGSQSLVGKEK